MFICPFARCWTIIIVVGLLQMYKRGETLPDCYGQVRVPYFQHYFPFYTKDYFKITCKSVTPHSNPNPPSDFPIINSVAYPIMFSSSQYFINL